MKGLGNMLGEHSSISPLWFMRLLACCGLGFDVGHKTGAVVNNSDTAVEM